MAQKNDEIKKKEKVFTLEFFQQCGKKGGAIGGVVGSANMTPEQRTARALKAVAARKWHPMLSKKQKAKRLAQKKAIGRPRVRPLPDPNAPKRPIGRPKLTDEEKAARAAARAAVRAAKVKRPRGRPKLTEEEKAVRAKVKRHRRPRKAA